MRENGVAQAGVWQARQNSRLHGGHNLTGLDAYHCEAENEIATGRR